MINENGTLHHISEVETGTSKSGNAWQKQTIVVSIEGRTPNYDKVALSVFGDKVNDCKGLKVGDKVKVSYSVSAREYNGKWYNDVSLFSIERAETQAPSAPTPSPVQNFDPQDGDLPF